MLGVRAASFGLLLVLVAFPACRGGDDEKRRPDPVDEMGEPPKLTVTPPPGTYDTYELDVRVAPADPDVELIVARNAAPQADDNAWLRGAVVTRLSASGSVRVLTRDREGRVFGPVSFNYRLAERYHGATCRIEAPPRLYYGPAEPIRLTITYSLSSSLSRVELLVNGMVADTLTTAPYAFGVTEMTASPLGIEGAYEVSCRVTAPLLDDVSGTAFTVYVDATPPGAAWITNAGWSPPTHYLLAGDDYGGAGIARAELCNSALSSCVPMRQLSATQFGFATALAAGGGAGFTLTARLYDAVGNRTDVSAAPVAASDLPLGAAPYLNAITLVTDATYDLAARLAADGLTAAEVRDLAFDLVPAAALALQPGWNEFLFRVAGAPDWQTFGVYQAGVSVTLPTLAGGAWLVYASTGTIPAMQGVRIDVVPGTAAQWARAWFQVPRLFFVADAGNDGAWNDADALYLLDATDAGGPWLREGVPLRAGLVPVSTTTAAAQSADLDCTGCAAGGTLVLQRRAARHAAPVGRQSWPAVDLSAGVAAAHAYDAQPGERCLFFWDESGDGAPGGREPRAEAQCDAPAFTLRRGETLAAAATGATLHFTGLPYGGAVTGRVDVTINAASILESPWMRFDERDGTGARAAPLPGYGSWPSTLTLWNDNAALVTSLPGQASAITTTGDVEVRDENNLLLAAAVEAHSPGVSDYALFDGVSASVALAYAEGTVPRVRALRDGYLSEWIYPSASFATLRLFSPLATGIVQGVVRDEAGQTVTGAAITWEADPYTAQTVSGPDGAYELPALGAGHLILRHAAGGAGMTVPLTLDAGNLVSLDLTLPSDGLRWPAGLLAGARTVTVTGPAPVTAFTDGRHAWAGVAPGVWALESPPNFTRAFTAPGALPAFALRAPTPHALSWSALLLEATVTLRCGAREQRIDFGAWLLIDVPCWDLYAEHGGTRFYLGRPTAAFGAPDVGLQRWFGGVNLNGSPAASYPVRLRDLVFARTFERTTDEGGRLVVVLPHGEYQVETLAGDVFRNAQGQPARIEVSHLGVVDQVVQLP